MASWTDPVRTIGVAIMERVADNRTETLFDGSRILSATWIEEAAMLGMPRRLGELTVRVSNDFAVGTGDRAGWRGPAMSAVKAEDPDAMVGKRLDVAVTIDGGSAYVYSGTEYVVDSVEAGDSVAAVHAVGLDSCLDRTLDEAGVSASLAATTRPITWCKDAMAAAGWDRTRIHYTGSNSPLGAACDLDGSMTVAEAVSGLLASSGRGYNVYQRDVYMTGMDTSSSGTWTGAQGWPVPTNSVRYGHLEVEDPAAGSSRTVQLDATRTGSLKVVVPYSASMDLARLTAWAKARYSDTLYAVRVPGANADWVSKPSLYVPVARWSDGTATKQQWMNVQRVEHSYDGGYSETLTGTLGSITTVA